MRFLVIYIGDLTDYNGVVYALDNGHGQTNVFPVLLMQNRCMNKSWKKRRRGGIAVRFELGGPVALFVVTGGLSF